MDDKNISCYLCRSEATQEDSSTANRNIRVTCGSCGNYEITDRALLFYFKRSDDKTILDDDDRKKLAEYVKAKSKREDGSTIVIDTKTVEKVTGKKSIKNI